MKRNWQDWVIFTFGVWLLCSPWLLQYFTGRQYTDLTAASWNSILIGLVAIYVAIWALADHQKWEEWTNLILGLWLVTSPWTLGFDTHTIATVNIGVVGGIITLAAAIGLARIYLSTHETAGKAIHHY